MAKSEGPLVRDLGAEFRDIAPEIYSALLVYAMKFTSSRTDAEDLAGNALLKAWHNKDSFDFHDRMKLGAWLKTIAKNTLLDELRKSKTHKKTAHKLKEDGWRPEHPDSIALASQAQRNRELLLARLDPIDRAMFKIWALQKDGHFTAKEAAVELGLAVSEYEAWKKRLERKLRKEMLELGLAIESLISSVGESSASAITPPAKRRKRRGP